MPVLFLLYYVFISLLVFPFFPSIFGILAFVVFFVKMGLTSSQQPVEYSPIIHTKSGPVRGKTFNFHGKKIDGYLGIPYAQPPVDKLRFQKPVPVQPWTETRDCLKFGPRSPQYDDFIAKQMNIVGQDEAGCLTINVIAPRWKSEEWPRGFPVMIWIHGGGFTIHSSSNYGDSTVARNLCTKDVVFVSLNYRLGVLGFFSTGDEKCAGNFGLWDQTMALKWVQDNISAFGGDPENVTIFGQSAGGVSVDLLSLSPHSRDLFKRVMPMAGTAECLFSLRTKEDQAAISHHFGRHLGWKGDGIDSLLDFMASQKSTRFNVDMAGQTFKHEEAGALPFVPNLDGDFFPASISELRKQMPKKDVLTGTTECEGLTLCFLLKLPYTMKGMKKLVDLIVTKAEYGEEVEAVKKEILDFYTKDLDQKDKSAVQLRFSQIFGDFCITNGAVKYAEKMSALGHNVYFYSFEYYNPDNWGLFRWMLPFRAASHITELRYVLGKGVVAKFKPNSDDLKMLEMMTTWVTNFAKYGNPNGKDVDGIWERHSASTPHRHFRIKLPEPEMMDDFQEKRSLFWYEKILPKNLTIPKVNEILEATTLEA